MQVSVNCKKKAIDLNSNYRLAFRNRVLSKKAFVADMEIDPYSGVVSFSKSDDGRVIQIDPDDVTDIAFFLDEDRPYAEIVRERGGKVMSFVYTTIEDNIELGQAGVFGFRETLDDVATPAVVVVDEFIDPNPLGICPDGVDSMEELIEIREAELGSMDNSGKYDELDLSQLATKVMEPIDVEYEVVEENVKPGDYLSELQQQIREEKARKERELEELTTRFGVPEGEKDPFETESEEEQSASDDVEEYEYECPYCATKVSEDAVYCSSCGQRIDGEEDEVVENEQNDSSDDEALNLVIEDIEEDEEIEESSETTSNLSIDDKNDEEYTISDKLSRLDASAQKIGATLDNYDDILAQTKTKQEVYVSKMTAADAVDPSMINGLVRMLQDQTDFNDDLNEKLKKEKVERRHCIAQLDAANKKLEEQSSALDEIRRRLRFSQENQRKSEKFVVDARSEIRRILAESEAKVASAAESVESMKKQVKASEEKAESAAQSAKEAEEARKNAEKAQVDLHERFEEERAANKKIAEEFSRQLDEFTSESVQKIQTQIARADEAERKYAEKTVRIAELESDLANARSLVDQADLDRSSAESDLLAAQGSYRDMVVEYESLKKRYDWKRGEFDKAEEELGLLRDEFDQLQEEYSMLKSQSGSEIEAVRKNMNARIRELEDKVAEEQRLRDAAENAVASTQEENAALTVQVNDLLSELGSGGAAIDDSGELLNKRESDLVNARSEIMRLSAEKSAIEEEYERKIADIHATRSALDIATESLMFDIQEINSMPSSFGNRKNKIDAMEAALDNYIRVYNRELDNSNVEYDDLDRELEDIIDDDDDELSEDEMTLVSFADESDADISADAADDDFDDADLNAEIEVEDDTDYDYDIEEAENIEEFEEDDEVSEENDENDTVSVGDADDESEEESGRIVAGTQAADNILANIPEIDMSFNESADDIINRLEAESFGTSVSTDHFDDGKFNDFGIKDFSYAEDAKSEYISIDDSEEAYEHIDLEDYASDLKDFATEKIEEITSEHPEFTFDDDGDTSEE